MFLEFFLWWYGRGWSQVWKDSISRSKNLQRTFSVGVLLKTLFAPWKRIVSVPGRSMDEKIRGLVDNMTSRAVGFFVRIGALFMSVILLLISLTAGLVITLLWPLLPILTVYLFYRGIVG